MSEKLRVSAYHEAGHACAGLVTPVRATFIAAATATAAMLALAGDRGGLIRVLVRGSEPRAVLREVAGGVTNPSFTPSENPVIS